MLRVDIAVPKRKWKELVEVLESWGKFHPEEYEGENKGKLTEEEITLRNTARRILSYIGEIESLFGNVFPVVNKGSLDFEGVRRVREGLMALVRDITTFEEEKRKLQDYLEISVLMEENKEEGKEIVVVVLGKGEIGSKEVLRRGLEDIEGVEFKEFSRGDNIIILIKVPVEHTERVKRFLEDNAFPIARPPKGYENLEYIKNAVEKTIPEAIGNLKAEAQASFESSKPLLEKQKFLAQDTLFYLNAKEKYLAFSKFLVSVKGWIPKDSKDELVDLIKEIDKDAVLRFQDPDREEYENVPVILKNKPPISYYQSFLDIYSPPVYKTIDPTVFIATFFPIYYGFMLGDAGYGIIGMFLFWLLSNAFKKGSMGYNLSMVYFINSIFTTIFGLIFGEIFGDFGIKLGIIKPLFHRTHEVIDLILIAIGFGFFQLLLGMLLGVYNYWILKHKKHSLFELGRFFAILGILLALLTYVKLPGISPKWVEGLPNYIGYIGIVSIVIGAIFTLIAEGPLGIIEIFSAFGNVLSYARLSAVGLASAILAEIANKFIELIPVPLFAILVGVVFHILAFVLGIIDPTIQGMRLQFVEFFTKFYVPATKIFKPLKKGGIL